MINWLTKCLRCDSLPTLSGLHDHFLIDLYIYDLRELLLMEQLGVY